jgi:hypothetical protein
MKLSDEFKKLDRQWSQYYRHFFRDLNGITCIVTDHTEFGIIHVNPGYNDPYAREQQSKHLGVRMALIHDVAHHLSYNGEQLKPNWFENNVVFCLDPDYKTAVCFGERYRQGVTYPSPDARPIGFEEIQFGLPNVKRGNAAVKEAKLVVGECKLRIGILGLQGNAWGRWGVDDLAKQFVQNDNALDLSSLPNNDLLKIVQNEKAFMERVRWYARDIITTKELDYAR